MMTLTALQQSIQTQKVSYYSPSGILAHIKLNHYEIVCIELALIGLEESIRTKNLPHELANFRLEQLSVQLRYIKYWFNKPALKAQCRLDGTNNVLWPFTSSETVDCLLRVCQSCIQEEAIVIAAADAACCEQAGFSEDSLACVHYQSITNDLLHCQFSAFQSYYNNIVRIYQKKLVKKLEKIRDQDYS